MEGKSYHKYDIQELKQLTSSACIGFAAFALASKGNSNPV